MSELHACPWDCNALLEYPEENCPGCNQPIEWVMEAKTHSEPGGLKPIRPGTAG
jgi:hypothetical protein